jgi:hypothetical protein
VRLDQKVEYIVCKSMRAQQLDKYTKSMHSIPIFTIFLKKLMFLYLFTDAALMMACVR